MCDCVHLSVTKLRRVSLSKMIMVRNCCCAVIDVQSLHKVLMRVRGHPQADKKKRKETQGVLKMYCFYSVFAMLSWKRAVVLECLSFCSVKLDMSMPIHSLHRSPLWPGC